MVRSTATHFAHLHIDGHDTTALTDRLCNFPLSVQRQSFYGCLCTLGHKLFASQSVKAWSAQLPHTSPTSTSTATTPPHSRTASAVFHCLYSAKASTGVSAPSGTSCLPPNQ